MCASFFDNFCFFIGLVQKYYEWNNDEELSAYYLHRKMLWFKY